MREIQNLTLTLSGIGCDLKYVEIEPCRSPEQNSCKTNSELHTSFLNKYFFKGNIYRAQLLLLCCLGLGRTATSTSSCLCYQTPSPIRQIEIYFINLLKRYVIAAKRWSFAKRKYWPKCFLIPQAQTRLRKALQGFHQQCLYK